MFCFNLFRFLGILRTKIALKTNNCNHISTPTGGRAKDVFHQLSNLDQYPLKALQPNRPEGGRKFKKLKKQRAQNKYS